MSKGRLFQAQVRVNHEVNPGVKVNLWLVNPRVNLSMEQSALIVRME